MSQVRRRQFLIATGALLAAGLARAQGSKKVAALGILSPGRKPPPEAFASHWHGMLMSRLRQLGWVEGKTLRLESVYAEEDLDRLPEFAATLVARKVDVIWTGSPWGALAAARATSAIPIVFWRAGFPVEYGLVDSLARPGRNVTGLAWFADASIYIKRLQILRELAPNARRLAIIRSPNTLTTVSGGMPDLKSLVDKAAAASRELGFEVHGVRVLQLADFEPAFASIANWGADSFGVPDVPLTLLAKKQIVDFARRHGLLDIYEQREWTEAGGLVSYGIAIEPTLLRTADMVDRILRGARPADIPVELPSHYEFVVNLATAKSHGFRIPTSILARADRVIE